MAGVCRKETAGNATCTFAGVAVKMEIYPVCSGDTIKPTDPINKLHNPPCIVKYADDKVTKNTAAIIRITGWQPRGSKGIRFPAADPFIKWSIDNSLGGDAKFFEGKDTGREVRIYGITNGEILVEADFGWVHKARFRAIVDDLKQIKYRVNRIFCGKVGPNVTVANIKDQIRVANIYLRQIGVKLVPDDHTDIADRNGNKLAGDLSVDSFISPIGSAIVPIEPGFYDVHVTHPALTDIQNGKVCKRRAIRVNAIGEILNIAYVYSIDGGNTLGEAVLIPANHLPGPSNNVTGAPTYTNPPITDGSNCVVDNGTPTPSWIEPNGLPDGTVLPRPQPYDARKHKVTGVRTSPIRMEVMDMSGDLTWTSASPSQRDTNLIWGLLVDGAKAQSGSTTLDPTFWHGNTLAHEFGHCLGLAHRETSQDKLDWPRDANLMHATAKPPVCEDLDIAQCKATRWSEFMFRANAASTAPEVERSDDPAGT
jgi:hypothetical protein